MAKSPRKTPRLYDATSEAVRGKVWWYRIPLVIPFVWIFYRHLANPEYESIFAGMNLAIHEGGHLLFMWFGGDFLAVAGGTLLQCLCPIVSGIMFYKQRDFFAIGIACFWLGTNFRAHRALRGGRTGTDSTARVPLSGSTRPRLELSARYAGAPTPGSSHRGRLSSSRYRHDGSWPLLEFVGPEGHGEGEGSRPALGSV